MVTPRQKEANQRNALKSSGPKSLEGKRRASFNAIKHGLSLPIDERLYGAQIAQVCILIRADCGSEDQAIELAKRIIDFERNETFLQNLCALSTSDEVLYREQNPQHIARLELLHELRAWDSDMRARRKAQQAMAGEPEEDARPSDIARMENILRIQSKVTRAKAQAARGSEESALRYQKRAINQLVKGVRALGRGEEI